MKVFSDVLSHDRKVLAAMLLHGALPLGRGSLVRLLDTVSVRELPRLRLWAAGERPRLLSSDGILARTLDGALRLEGVDLRWIHGCVVAVPFHALGSFAVVRTGPYVAMLHSVGCPGSHVTATEWAGRRVSARVLIGSPSARDVAAAVSFLETGDVEEA